MSDEMDLVSVPSSQSNESFDDASPIHSSSLESGGSSGLGHDKSHEKLVVNLTKSVSDLEFHCYWQARLAVDTSADGVFLETFDGVKYYLDFHHKLNKFVVTNKVDKSFTLCPVKGCTEKQSPATDCQEHAVPPNGNNDFAELPSEFPLPGGSSPFHFGIVDNREIQEIVKEMHNERGTSGNMEKLLSSLGQNSFVSGKRGIVVHRAARQSLSLHVSTVNLEYQTILCANAGCLKEGKVRKWINWYCFECPEKDLQFLPVAQADLRGIVGAFLTDLTDGYMRRNAADPEAAFVWLKRELWRLGSEGMIVSKFPRPVVMCYEAKHGACFLRYFDLKTTRRVCCCLVSRCEISCVGSKKKCTVHKESEVMHFRLSSSDIFGAGADKCYFDTYTYKTP